MRRIHFRYKLKHAREKRCVKRALNMILVLAALAVIVSSCRTENFEQYTQEDYRVKSGDTLWTLAEKYYDGDLRTWIAEVEKINNHSAGICTGETIKILVKKGDL